MNDDIQRQRLAAIVAADAVGYSRLMEANERETVVALETARSVFAEEIEANQGRVINMAGDSVLAIFDSAAGAVNAAIAAQRRLIAMSSDVPDNAQLRFRIGVHLGDVISSAGGDIHGDGVNIAARLQALAEPGGILVSESVRGAVKNRIDAAFSDRGKQTIKNISDPVRAFAVVLRSICGTPRRSGTTIATANLFDRCGVRDHRRGRRRRALARIKRSRGGQSTHPGCSGAARANPPSPCCPLTMSAATPSRRILLTASPKT